MIELEKKAMYNMLTEIKRLAADASLTGALRKGAPTLVMTYNKCLATLKEKGDNTAGQLFPELPPDAGIDDVGVAAALLASYLQPKKRRRGLHPAFAEHMDAEEYEDEEEEEID